MNNETTDERRLQLWHEFEAGGPPATELLSFDQRKEDPWSFAATPLFAPTPKEEERLKGHKVDLDENTVIGGDFITCEGDWKIKSVGGSAYSHGKSTQTIESVGRYAYSYGESTQTIDSVGRYASSQGTSTQTIGSVDRSACSWDKSTQKIKSVGGNAMSADASTQTVRSVDGNAESHQQSTQNIESVNGHAVSHDASRQNRGAFNFSLARFIHATRSSGASYGKSTQNTGAAAPEARRTPAPPGRRAAPPGNLTRHEQGEPRNR